MLKYAAGFAIVLVSFAILNLVSRSGEEVPRDPVPVKLRIYPLRDFKIGAPDQVRFGALEWRGGFEVEADSSHFGGLSAIAFLDAEDELAIVSDTGTWIRTRLVGDADGQLRGFGPTTLQSLPGPDGRPLLGKELSDAESLAIRDENGRRVAYVGFERLNRVLAYPLDADGRPLRPRDVPLPFPRNRLRYSKGLETLAFAPPASSHAGALIAISERSLNRAGNIRGWIIGGPRPGAFAVRRHDDFDVTDGGFLPNGDLILLERRYRPADGVALRMRRIAGADLMPGKTIDGRRLIDVDMRHAIDNFEGIALRRNDRDETEILLISDNNHSILQRNIVMRFVLVED